MSVPVSPETPAWAGVFIDWFHPSSLICAGVFPLLRSLILVFRGLPVTLSVWIEGVSSGFTFPSFIALALSSLPSLSTALRPHLEGHAFALAGAMGVIYTIGSLVKTEHEEAQQRGFARSRY